ncbi:Glutathione S-transferase S1 [Actinomortierella ambigua]|uniref:Glutathione S-transferase S1 n=1 Tax=Actinomortierella ambigua TaxID=1343610 RepID=A0A9P6TZE5_9FUNG|nr:Glutathione S-transferase S1 [Actinomortierella ambigua]
MVQTSSTQSSQQLSTLATQRDGSKFSLWYFKLHGLAISTRALLAISGADWSDKYQNQGDEWAARKDESPFGVLPVLYETTSDGQTTLQIAERDAIERYIAQKFGLSGDNAWEQVLVNEAVSLNQSLFNYWVYRILYSGPEEQAKALEDLKSKHLPLWVRNVESILIKNGKNGHFVGNHFTHADAHASAVVDIMLSIVGTESVLNEKTAPNLLAAHKKTVSHPGYAAYRKSDDWAFYINSMNKFLEPKFAFDFNRAMV